MKYCVNYSNPTFLFFLSQSGELDLGWYFFCNLFKSNFNSEGLYSDRLRGAVKIFKVSILSLKQLKHQLDHQGSHFNAEKYHFEVWLSLCSLIIILLLPFNPFYCFLCYILLGCDSSLPSNVWAFLWQEISVRGCVQFHLLDWLFIAAVFNMLTWLMHTKRERERCVFHSLFSNALPYVCLKCILLSHNIEEKLF